MARYEKRPCLDCGKIRNVQMRNGAPISLRCHPCGARHRARTAPDSWLNREGHPRWKGGRHLDTNGYCSIVVPLDNPFLAMADSRGRVYEHRLVMAQSLGRCLFHDEEVHHINADKQDNHLSNLRLLSKGEHSREHHAEVQRLRTEVRRWRQELRQAQSS